LLPSSTALPDSDLTTHEGIPVTSYARTLCDLARVLGGDDLTRAMREMQFMKRFDLEAVQETERRRPARLLRRLLDDMAATQSYTEEDFLRLCARNRIPRPLTQCRLGGSLHKFDFVWPEQRLAVEVDDRPACQAGSRAA
jgi:hypothetical protein